MGHWSGLGKFFLQVSRHRLTYVKAPFRTCGCWCLGCGVRVHHDRTSHICIDRYDSIFSFFPPSTTIRSYQRRTLATTSSELGAIYCSIMSYANTRVDKDNTVIVQSLLAIRSKLKRSLVLKTNVIYEVNTDFQIYTLTDDATFSSFRCADNGPPRGTTRYWRFKCEDQCAAIEAIFLIQNQADRVPPFSFNVRSGAPGTRMGSCLPSPNADA